MASLEQNSRTGRFYLRFRFGGEEYKRSLKIRDAREAEAVRGRVEETLLLIERGRLEIPKDADAARFILSDGRSQQKPVAKRVLSLGELIAVYEGEYTVGAKEKNTLLTESRHFKHHKRLLGLGSLVTDIDSSALQKYVNDRAAEAYRGRGIKPQTIRKEIGTLQAVFSWAAHRELIPSSFSTRRLVFPKGREKLPFQTYDQIAEIVLRGGLSTQAERELWDGLFLDTKQIGDVLEYVRQNSTSTWFYPCLVAAAHTGARRSELLRARIEDFNFGNACVTIREKKKSKERETFRVVDMTPMLAQVMRAYFAGKHPGGSFAFEIRSNEPIDNGLAAGAFRWAFRKGKWSVLRGYHVFRHSFASNLSAAGIDQRIIDELMGHQTEAMRRRYRHMFPDLRRKAVESVFGKG